MEPLAILQADPLDLLFENRNKKYGAYPVAKILPAETDDVHGNHYVAGRIDFIYLAIPRFVVTPYKKTPDSTGY